jgi:uncharacterized damage-inducible protein DinB
MSSASHMVDGYLAGIQTLRQAVAGMTRDQLLKRPVPGKWSTQEVVCHLVDSEQAWVHRMKRVIAENRPLYLGYDEARFAAALPYHESDVEEELNLFEQTRRQMARILRTLPPQAWGRDGVHSERGLLTLEQMLQVETEHVPHHVKFILEKRRALGV